MTDNTKRPVITLGTIALLGAALGPVLILTAYVVGIDGATTRNADTVRMLSERVSKAEAAAVEAQKQILANAQAAGGNSIRIEANQKILKNQIDSILEILRKMDDKIDRAAKSRE